MAQGVAPFQAQGPGLEHCGIWEILQEATGPEGSSLALEADTSLKLAPAPGSCEPPGYLSPPGEPVSLSGKYLLCWLLDVLDTKPWEMLGTR